MVPWPADPASAELGPALVALLRHCERLRVLAFGDKRTSENEPVRPAVAQDMAPVPALGHGS